MNRRSFLKALGVVVAGVTATTATKTTAAVATGGVAAFTPADNWASSSTLYTTTHTIPLEVWRQKQKILIENSLDPTEFVRWLRDNKEYIRLILRSS
jgi:hypothetical protein